MDNNTVNSKTGSDASLPKGSLTTEYTVPYDMREDMPTKRNTTYYSNARPVHTNAWWDDSKPDRVLLGPRGEVLSRLPGRQIGFKLRNDVN